MQFEQLVNEHMKEAMKSGDRLRLDTLRMLRAAIIEFHKSGNAQNGMTEEDEQKILLNAANLPYFITFMLFYEVFQARNITKNNIIISFGIF